MTPVQVKKGAHDPDVMVRVASANAARRDAKIAAYKRLAAAQRRKQRALSIWAIIGSSCGVAALLWQILEEVLLHG